MRILKPLTFFVQVFQISILHFVIDYVEVYNAGITSFSNVCGGQASAAAARRGGCNAASGRQSLGDLRHGIVGGQQSSSSSTASRRRRFVDDRRRIASARKVPLVIVELIWKKPP